MNRTRPRVRVQAPKAKRDQAATQEWEGLLLNAARERHPAAQWWHGYRKVDGVMSDVCYVCDRVIVAGAVNVIVTVSTQAAVSEHKFAHAHQIVPAKLLGSTERNTA